MPGLVFDTLNLASDEERSLGFTVQKPGRLQIRNSGTHPFESRLHALIGPTQKSEHSLGLGTIDIGKVVIVPVVPGNYRIRLQESGDYEEPMCPPISLRAAISMAPPMTTLAWADQTKIPASPKAIGYKTTLSAMNPEPGFFMNLTKPSYVEVKLTDGGASRPKILLLPNGQPQGAIYRRSIVGDGRYSFGFERAEGLPLDRVDTVNFTARAIPLLGERIFESVPEKSEVEVLDRVTAKIVFKNLAPLDFRKVTLVFGPFFKGAAMPAGMSARTVYGRPAWAKTFDEWKAGEEKTVDFGVLFPRINQIQSYVLTVFVTTSETHHTVIATTLDTPHGPIPIKSEHVLRGEISLTKLAKSSLPKKRLAIDQANTVEHPDYESQLKIPVMTNCSKKFPQYGEPFEKCQGLVFKWRNHCSATHIVTTSIFVDCVRKGLEREAPDLLKRP
jgi:hypothetical protein